jgi:hypothetical protein
MAGKMLYVSQNWEWYERLVNFAETIDEPVEWAAGVRWVADIDDNNNDNDNEHWKKYYRMWKDKTDPRRRQERGERMIICENCMWRQEKEEKWESEERQEYANAPWAEKKKTFV